MQLSPAEGWIHFATKTFDLFLGLCGGEGCSGFRRVMESAGIVWGCWCKVSIVFLWRGALVTAVWMEGFDIWIIN